MGIDHIQGLRRKLSRILGTGDFYNNSNGCVSLISLCCTADISDEN